MSVSSVTSSASYSYDTTVQTKKSTQSDTSAQVADVSTQPNDVSSFNTPTKWGFKVDSNGFFGTDFNKAAGLPENMKVHQKMMDMADEYSKARGDNMDPLTMVSKVWNLYKTVAGNTLDSDGDGYMSQEDVDKMPKSYISKGSLTDGIVSVQNSFSEYGAHLVNIKEARPLLEATGFSPNSGIREFSGMVYGNDTSKICANNVLNVCAQEYESYTNTPYEGKKDNGSISVGELFGSFFFTSVNNETQELKSTSNIETNMNSVKATKAYYAFLDSGQDIKGYIEKTQGNNAYAQMIQRMGTQADGKFDQNTVDWLMDELDKSIKQGLKEYKASNFPSLDPLKEIDDVNGMKESKNQKSPYYTAAQKLQSGSLISASA